MRQEKEGNPNRAELLIRKNENMWYASVQRSRIEIPDWLLKRDFSSSTVWQTREIAHWALSRVALGDRLLSRKSGLGFQTSSLPLNIG